MNFKKLVFFSLLFSFSLLGKDICPHISIEDGKLSLNPNEKILVCGKADGPEGWRETPLAQARLHIEAILSDLGYHHPKFEEDFLHLKVWKGKKTYVKKVIINGDEGNLRFFKKRKIINHPMIPEKLNELEEWANLQTKSKSYACSKHDLKAYPDEEEVSIQTSLGASKIFPNYDVTGIENFEPNILDRYLSFKQGEPYDIRETQITTSRMMSSGLFQSAFFSQKCLADNLKMQLETSVGKPNLFRFGIGASTEEAPFVDASYKNTYIDKRASSYLIGTHLSPRLRQIFSNAELYLIPSWSKTFFAPKIKFSWEDEEAYKVNTAKLSLDLARVWDFFKQRFNFSVGPSVNVTKTLRGEGPKNVTYSALDVSLQIMNHTYEYEMRDQYAGHIFNFYYHEQNEVLGSSINLRKYSFNVKKIWNLGHYSPPLFVLATRLETTLIDLYGTDDLSKIENIPIDERIFMGGDQNLRGFPRGNLNNSKKGYLSSLYLGFELRLIEELPYKLQPFLLFDLGKLGTTEHHFDAPLYLSKGIGLRFASPFGTLRASAAKGSISSPNDETREIKTGWNYFVSFGQEF